MSKPKYHILLNSESYVLKPCAMFIHVQTFYLCYLHCIELCQPLLALVEKFIMLPRSRTRTHHIYMLLLHWKYATTCLLLLLNTPKFAVWSLSKYLAKETWTMQRYWKQWTCESPSIEKKICVEKGDQKIAMSQNNHKLERDLVGSTIKFIIIFHTHAHLDLRAWNFSPWTLVLTLQYMQCKYAYMFIPTWAPNKPDRIMLKKQEM
jgi:hypothetical protein